MQQETTTTPHVWLLLSNVVTAILAVAGTLSTLWFKRKREPAEVRKIDAEAAAALISPVGITLETLREIQVVIQKAEDRREEWRLREEQMRGQIIHWRSKAEDLDGQLADSRDANAQLMAQAKLNNYQLLKQMNFIIMKNLKDEYVALDQPKE
jgi:hypothetical protein